MSLASTLQWRCTYYSSKHMLDTITDTTAYVTSLVQSTPLHTKLEGEGSKNGWTIVDKAHSRGQLMDSPRSWRSKNLPAAWRSTRRADWAKAPTRRWPTRRSSSRHLDSASIARTLAIPRRHSLHNWSLCNRHWSGFSQTSLSAPWR